MRLVGRDVCSQQQQGARGGKEPGVANRGGGGGGGQQKEGWIAQRVGQGVQQRGRGG